MASGQDPLADMQNLIGYQGLVGDNPFIVQPGQLQPFGSPAGMGMGFGQMAAGIPTDAHGNPIGGGSQPSYPYAPSAPVPAQPPGQTINSLPVGGPPSASGTFDYAKMGPSGSAIQELMNNYQAAQAKLSPQQLYNQAQTRQMDFSNAQNIANLNMNRTAGGGFGAGNNVINTGPNYASPMQMMGSAQPAAAQPAAAAAPAGALSRTQYLSLLANPGKPTAYGAAPPAPGQTPTGSQGPNVTNAFLAANAGKSTPYLSTLRNLQGGTA